MRGLFCEFHAYRGHVMVVYSVAFNFDGSINRAQRNVLLGILHEVTGEMPTSMWPTDNGYCVWFQNHGLTDVGRRAAQLVIDGFCAGLRAAECVSA